jgi:hypothetical protein
MGRVYNTTNKPSKPNGRRSRPKRGPSKSMQRFGHPRFGDVSAAISEDRRNVKLTPWGDPVLPYLRGEQGTDEDRRILREVVGWHTNSQGEWVIPAIGVNDDE